MITGKSKTWYHWLWECQESAAK